MLAYFVCDHLKVCWSEIKVKEEENRMVKERFSE